MLAGTLAGQRALVKLPNIANLGLRIIVHLAVLLALIRHLTIRNHVDFKSYGNPVIRLPQGTHFVLL